MNNRIDDFMGEVAGTSPEYKHYEKSFGIEEIYYKAEGDKLTDVICEAYHQDAATKVVSEFLSTLS